MAGLSPFSANARTQCRQLAAAHEIPCGVGHGRKVAGVPSAASEPNLMLAPLTAMTVFSAM